MATYRAESPVHHTLAVSARLLWPSHVNLGMMKQDMRLRAPEPGSTNGLAGQVATPAETDLGGR